MASKTVEQISKVLEELKRDILNDLANGMDVSGKDAEAKVATATKNVAQQLGKTRSTIHDKCTRQIGLIASEFYEKAVDYLTRKNNDLEEIVVSNLKPSIDSEAQVRQRLQRII